MSDFANQLTTLLPTLIRSAGSGGLTTAANVRNFESRVIEAVAALEIRARGSRIFAAQLYGAQPDPASGLEGDLFIELDTLDVWTYVDGVWGFLVNLIPRTSAFPAVAANQYGSHPAFTSQLEWNVWLTQHLGTGGIALPQLGTPTGFAAGSITSSSVTLSWAAPASATAYVVQRATNSAFTTGLVTIYTGANTTVTNSTGLAASTMYYYRVKAQGAGYQDSGYATAQAATSATAPAAPNISGASPNSAAVGALVTLTGSGFATLSAFTLNGTAITSYTVVSATSITFTVPVGATTGVISLITANGTATSTGSFTVTAGAGSFLFSLTGQSNSISVGKVADIAGTPLASLSPALVNRPYDHAQILYLGLDPENSTGTLEPLDPPTSPTDVANNVMAAGSDEYVIGPGNPDQCIGGETFISYIMDVQQPGVPVTTLKRTADGQPISVWFGPNGIAAKQLADWNHAKTLDPTLGPAHIWAMVQGEADASRPVADYQADLANLIQIYRTGGLIGPNTFVPLVGIKAGGNTDTAKRNLVAADTTGKTKFIVTTDVSTNSDGVHYNVGGQALIWQRVFNACYGTSVALVPDTITVPDPTPGAISDSFTRADGPIGTPWTLVGGATPNILSNKAYISGPSAFKGFVQPSSLTDWTVQVTMTTAASADAFLVFQFQDFANYGFVQFSTDSNNTSKHAFYFYRAVGGGYTGMGPNATVGGFNPAGTYIVQVKKAGNVYTLTVNGTLLATYTGTTGLETNDRFGLVAGVENNITGFASFSVVA